MLEIVFLTLFSPLIVALIYWYYYWFHWEKYLRNIPGPKPWPLLGSAWFLRSPTAFLVTLRKYYDFHKGVLFKVFVREQMFLAVCEADFLEHVLNSTTIITKANGYRFLHNWLGTGLLTSAGDKWRKHRKIITPAFHFKILEDFIDVFNTNGDIMVSKLKAESNKGSFDIYPYVNRCTLDIICEAVMGTSVNAQSDHESEYVKCVDVLLRIVVDRNLSPILSNDFLYRFTSTYRKEKYALKIVHDYSRSVIERRRKEFLNNPNINREDVDILGRKKKRAFLDSLLEHSLQDPTLTEENIREEVDTFMFEGHDTTGTSIAFALYSLATNPEVQEKAYVELQKIFCDDPKRSPTYKDLQEMKYLEMVIKESLRIYPAVPFYARSVETDFKWKNTVIPKGVTLFIAPHVFHNSELFFENPEKFQPERFSAENVKNRNPFVYVPFSAGPRNCIGQKFAMLEMKSTISNVLRNFKLSLSPGHKVVLKGDLILKSNNGIMIRLKDRN